MEQRFESAGIDDENAVSEAPEAPKSKRSSRLISRLLPPAIRFWLHTQVEAVEELSFEIQGTDRQILSGYIPGVAVAAQRAVYQGLYLTQVNIQAENIRFNLGRILRGKSLQLQETFPVIGAISMAAEDLNASLSAPLLKAGLEDFLRRLIEHDGLDGRLGQAFGMAAPAIGRTTLKLHPDQLTLYLEPDGVSGTLTSIAIRTGLAMHQGRYLVLLDPHLLDPRDASPLPLKELAQFSLDLGPHVNLRTLKLEAGQVVCQGDIQVVPGDPP